MRAKYHTKQCISYEGNWCMLKKVVSDIVFVMQMSTQIISLLKWHVVGIRTHVIYIINIHISIPELPIQL